MANRIVKERTKKGCSTCKQRRIKCDEQKPCCARCAKSLRSCSYPKKSKSGLKVLIPIAPCLKALPPLPVAEPGPSTAPSNPSPSPPNQSPVYNPPEIEEPAGFYDSGISVNGSDDFLPSPQQETQKEMGDLTTDLRNDNPHEAQRTAHSCTILCLGDGVSEHATKLGTTYPEARVLVGDRWPFDECPGNVYFFEDDMQVRWALDNDSTIFVYLRNVMHSFNNCLHIYEEAWRILEPGGMIEIVQLEYKLYNKEGVLESECLDNYTQQLHHGLSMEGQNGSPIPSIEAALHRCGFTDITDRVDRLPTGNWLEQRTLRVMPGEVAKKVASDIWSNGWQLLQHVNSQARLELCFPAAESLKVANTYFNVHTVIAQKPRGSL